MGRRGLPFKGSVSVHYCASHVTGYGTTGSSELDMSVGGDYFVDMKFENRIRRL